MTHPTEILTDDYKNKLTGKPLRNPEWRKLSYETTVAGATTGNKPIQISGISEHLIAVSIEGFEFTAGAAAAVFIVLPQDLFSEMPISDRQSIPITIKDNGSDVIGEALLARHDVPTIGLRYSIEVAPLAGNFTDTTACGIYQTTLIFRISDN